MSRAMTEAVLALAILALAGGVYLVAASTIQERTSEAVHARASQVRDSVLDHATKESFERLKRVEDLAADPGFATALGAEGKKRQQLADLGFNRFVQSQTAQGNPRPDILALVNLDAEIVAIADATTDPIQTDAAPVANMWKRGRRAKYRALSVALSEPQAISEVWDDDRGLLAIGVASVQGEGDRVIGAVVLAFAMDDDDAASRAARFRAADIAYFAGERIGALGMVTSAPTMNRETLGKALSRVIADSEISAITLQDGVLNESVSIALNGKVYVATAVRMPQLSSRPRPEGYPYVPAGILVMLSAADASLGTLQVLQLSIGGVVVFAMLLMILGFEIWSRRILNQVGAVEMVLTDAARGHVRHVPPVGRELDGLARATAAALARVSTSHSYSASAVHGSGAFETGGHMPSSFSLDVYDSGSAQSASAAALSSEAMMAIFQEPEDIYYQRLFDEYCAACEQAGISLAEVSYEQFVRKVEDNALHFIEHYQCRAVRFQVIRRQDQVSLKPLPIA